MSDFRDRTLRCGDCGSSFVFTAGEQAFYNERGFSEPKRCPACRSARKAGQAKGGSTSGERFAGGGEAGRYGGSDRGGRKDRPARQMYDVICADCGEPTQVPFQPRDDRPVYCRDCYERHRNY